MVTTKGATSKGLHIPSLDGLRTVSFAIVFIAHAGWNRFIPGPFGVTVFFFLSGYLITTLSRLEFERHGTVAMGKFYLRRALRILPPFYLVIALSLGLSWLHVVRPPTEPASVIALLLHYANYYIVAHDNGGFPAGTGVYWSLAVEEHFYFLFPWAYLALVRRKLSAQKQATILLAVCGLFLLWRCALVFLMQASALRTSVASDTRFDSLLFGCMLAVYGNPALDSSRFSEKTWKTLLFPLGIAGLLACFAIRADAFRETLRYSLQGLSLVPIFVCGVRYPGWLPMRLLNLRPIAFIGTLSYSLYLVHQVVQHVVGENLPQMGLPAQAVLSLLGSFLLALLLYRFVEKPCANLRRRLQG